MFDHIAMDDIEQFVVGTLPAERRNQLAKHMASCTACAQALADEARFEVALTEATRASSFTAR
jgi:anti-sigma factor RsiW